MLRTFQPEKFWDDYKQIDNPKQQIIYDFSSIYEEAFPKFEIKIKQKKPHQSPDY